MLQDKLLNKSAILVGGFSKKKFIWVNEGVNVNYVAGGKKELFKVKEGGDRNYFNEGSFMSMSILKQK